MSTKERRTMLLNASRFTGKTWEQGDQIDEFSTFGRLFTLDSFCKGSQILGNFLPGKSCALILPKNWIFLGDFFTNSSGHPAWEVDIENETKALQWTAYFPASSFQRRFCKAKVTCNL
jgi:hypothetical protein